VTMGFKTSERKALVKCHLILMKEMPNIDKLFDFMYQSETLHPNQIEDLMDIECKVTQKRVFLICALRRALVPDPFNVFCNALEYAGKAHLSKKLKEMEKSFSD